MEGILMSNGQITLGGFEKPNSKEADFLHSIWASMEAAVEEAGADKKLLTNGTVDSYTVVKLGNLTICRLRFRGKQHYIALPTIFKDLIPEGTPYKSVKSELKYIRVLIDEERPLESYHNLLIKAATESVNRYPKEWDCCSRYMDCSNAKTCTHPDKGFALGCGYRRILSSGRVFYGKNRNID